MKNGFCGENLQNIRTRIDDVANSPGENLHETFDNAFTLYSAAEAKNLLHLFNLSLIYISVLLQVFSYSERIIV